MPLSANTQAAAGRLAPYVEELHEFFASHRMHFGSPEDLLELSRGLEHPGTFRGELSSMVRSVIFREGGNVPRSELLKLVALSIGGPEIVNPPPEMQEPVSYLMDFLSGVARAPRNQPPPLENLPESAAQPPNHARPNRLYEATSPLYSSPVHSSPSGSTAPSIAWEQSPGPEPHVREQLIPPQPSPLPPHGGTKNFREADRPTEGSQLAFDLQEALKRLNTENPEVKRYLASIYEQLNELESASSLPPTFSTPSTSASTPLAPASTPLALATTLRAADSLPSTRDLTPAAAAISSSASGSTPLATPDLQVDTRPAISPPAPSPRPENLFSRATSSAPALEPSSLQPPMSQVQPIARDPWDEDSELQRNLRRYAEQKAVDSDRFVYERPGLLARLDSIPPRAKWLGGVGLLLLLLFGGIALQHESISPLERSQTFAQPIISPHGTAAPEGTTAAKPTPYGLSTGDSRSSVQRTPAPRSRAAQETTPSPAASATVANPTSPSATLPASSSRIEPPAAQPVPAAARQPQGSSSPDASPADQSSDYDTTTYADSAPTTRSRGRNASGQPTLSFPKNTPGGLLVSSGVMAGNLIFSTPPQYPRLASMAHIQGQVLLQAVISKSGRVDHLHIIQGHRLLRGAATEAVYKWRYRPYVVNGHPVDVATIVRVDFQLHR